MPTFLARFVTPGTRRVSALAAVSALALTSGCLSSDKLTGNSNGGQFTATVTGDLQGPLSGNAELVKVVASSTSPAGVAVGLIDQGGAVLAFQWNNVSVLTPGTTTVGTDSTMTGMVLVLPGSGSGTRYTGTAGTVTLSAVTPTSVTGSFSVGAAASDVNKSITVNGNFVATVVGATAP